MIRCVAFSSSRARSRETSAMFGCEYVVIADIVSFAVDAAKQIGGGFRVHARHEERRRHAVTSKHVEHARRVVRIRTVVERQRDHRPPRSTGPLDDE